MVRASDTAPAPRAAVTQRPWWPRERPPLVDHREVRANRSRARRISADRCASGRRSSSGVALGLAVSIVAGAVGGAVVLGARRPGLSRGWPPPSRSGCSGPARCGEDELPRLQNLVDGLCPTFGVRRPTLMAVDDELPNACSLGYKPDRGVLVVTTGLEAALDLIEMEGVIGHELSHFKRGDTVVSSVAVTVLAPFSWLIGERPALAPRRRPRARAPGRPGRRDGGPLPARAVRRAAAIRGEQCAPSRFGVRRPAVVDVALALDRPGGGRRGAETMGDLDLTSVRIDALAEL